MTDAPVPVVWSPATRMHEPVHEVWVGAATPAVEVPARVDAILDALAGSPLHEAAPHDDAVLVAVHDAALLRFLPGVADAWAAGPYADAGRPAPGRALLLPDAGAARRHGADAGRGAARARPAVTATTR